MKTHKIKVMVKKTSLWLGVVAGVTLCAGVGSAYADNYSFRVGSGHPAVLAYVSIFRDYFIPTVTKRVAAETNHTVKFTEAYGGSVAKLPEVFDVVESGLLDIGLLSTPFEPSNLFLQNFGYRAPFGESDPVKAGKISRKLYDTFPALTDSLLKHNQVPLAVLNSSNYSLITKMPWKTFDDLAGHKILAAGANIRWLTGTGATPVQGGLGQAYNGIQTGVYDGMIIHYQGMKGFKLFEVAPYIALVDFGSLPINLMTVNSKTWDRLPTEIQEIFRATALEYEQKVNVFNRDADKTVIAEMVKKGATVLDVSAEFESKWADMLVKLPVDAANEGDKMGFPMRKLLALYIEELKSIGNKSVGIYSLQ